jgi:hypothetical protein
MPHWGLAGSLLNELLSDLDRGLQAEFHARDARRLVMFGRALGHLSRVGWDDPQFQVSLQGSRDTLASQVKYVRDEAARAAGDKPPAPELLLSLTEALAAAFADPRP